jgi:DNA-binding LacI/PurR family transcriptional regulator
VNYKVAQQAMATLAKEGYVTRQARLGTVVKGIPRRGVVGIYVNLNLMSSDASNEYYRLITGHLGDLLDRHSRVHRMYLGGLAPGANTACEDLLRHISGGTLCGAMLVNMPIEHVEQIVEQGRRMHIPVVSFSGGSSSDYSVRMDYVGYVRTAAEFLRRQGRQRIGLIYNRWSMRYHEAGVDAQMLREIVGAQQPRWVVGFTANEDGGYEAAAKLPLDEIDGLIVEDDVMALGVARRLRETNVRIPGDLVVTTTWNRGSRLELPMSFERFELDVAEQARTGLHLMEDAINGQRIDQPHIKLMSVHQPAAAPAAERRSR